MISILKGEVLEATPLQVVLDVHGVGYEVHVPVTTAERLPAIGGAVKLFTTAVYREDSQAIYGFIKREERDFFRILIDRVSGVGPKVALAIMSKLSLPLLQTAISQGDVRLLSQCPGIGKKTAERIVIELKDKVMPGMGGGAPSAGDAGISTSGTERVEVDPVERNRTDATLALVSLGYKPADADKAVRRAMQKLEDEASTEEIIRAALS